jgi:hypothetical protein
MVPRAGPARVPGTLNIFVESLGRHPSSADLASVLVNALVEAAP